MKINVLLCSHNGALYIEDQVNSILLQSSTVDNLYIYDFNSTDETIEILEKLSNDKIIINRINYAPGASMSFFHAFDDLSKKIDPNDIVFLSDQDDIWKFNKVETITKLFENSTNNYDLIFHDVSIVSDSLNLIHESFYKSSIFVLPYDLRFENIILSNPVIGHTMAFRGRILNILSEISNKNMYLMHDWAILIFSKILGRVFYTDEVLSLYRQHSSNVLGFSLKRSKSITKLIDMCTNIHRQYLILCDEVNFGIGKKIDINRLNNCSKIFPNKINRNKAFLILFCNSLKTKSYKRKMLGFIYLYLLFASLIN